MNPFCVNELTLRVLRFVPVSPTDYHVAMGVSRKWNVVLQRLAAVWRLLLEFELCQKIDMRSADECAMGVLRGKNASDRFPFLHVLAQHIDGVANSCSLLVRAARHVDLFAGPSLMLPRCSSSLVQQRIGERLVVFDPNKLYISYIGCEFWADLNSGKFESSRGYRHRSLLRVCQLLQGGHFGSVSRAVDADVRENYYPMTDGRFAWRELTNRQFVQIYEKVRWLTGTDKSVIDLAIQSYNRVRLANQNQLFIQQTQARQHRRKPKHRSNTAKKNPQGSKFGEIK